MEIREHLLDGKTVLYLSGSISGIESIQLARMLEDYRKNDCGRLVIDMKEVQFIDSTALGGFIYLSKMMEKAGICLELHTPPIHLQELFTDCSLESILYITSGENIIT
ncbi:MAG: STAS domain-containing protein [Chitinivibrionales bacterium]|nr:STAS domain-containing protein [Chitinivibrionales bacterium]